MIPLNHTPFELSWLVGKLKPPASSLTVIVKGTFHIEEGGVLKPAARQRVLCGDMHVDDDTDCSLVYSSDFVYLKPRADILVAGSCYAPGGRPTSVVQARVTVGRFSKNLLVVGDRSTEDSRKGSPAEPKPFLKLDLSYENAYGGPTFPRNPLGKGHAPEPGPGGRLVYRLPNILAPGASLSSREEFKEPAGFAPIPSTWPQRSSKMGTFDKAWQRNRWPGFPVDMDMSCWNAAPQDQQIEGYLKGDEELRFENLHPSQKTLTSRLPGLRIRTFYARPVGPALHTTEIETHLDTLWVNLDESTLILVWRGVMDLAQHDLSPSDLLLVDSEDLRESSKPLSIAQATLAGATPSGLKIESAATDDSTDATPDVEEVSDVPVDEQPTMVAQAEPPAISRALCLERLARKESFRGLDLTGADLSRLPLRGVDFTEAILTNAKLEGAELAGANFTDAVLANANLDHADLTQANLENADLTGARLMHASLREAHLDRARLSHATLCNADLTQALATSVDLSRADLSKCSLHGANLTNADLSGTQLHETILTEANLTDASVEGAWGERTNAAGALLTDLKASDARFLLASFRNTKASHSTWSDAQLVAADFSEAELPGAMFNGATLVEATFRRAILKNARFIGGHLPKASFVLANLFCANFSKADLSGADFSRSNLFYAEFLEATLDGALFDGANVKRTLLATRS